MLQTSSNRSNLKRLARTSVTNVVNLRPKTLIFSEKAIGSTTFVTTVQKSTRKTPPIDDVCNNTHRSIPKSQRDEPDHIGGPENPAAAPRGLRCPWAEAVPGRATHRPPTDWRPPRGLRGLAGLRADAPSEARGADGERAGRPRGGRRSVGATSPPRMRRWHNKTARPQWARSPVGPQQHVVSYNPTSRYAQEGKRRPRPADAGRGQQKMC